MFNVKRLFDVYENDDDDRGNSLPSFISHEEQQISCSVNGYKIVNCHNAVAEDNTFMQLFVASDFIISKYKHSITDWVHDTTNEMSGRSGRVLDFLLKK